VPLARHQTGELPKGRWWNGFETLLTFIRDDVAEPNLHEDTDTYLPFLWTMFLFILTCNLLGMIPTFGSPTAQVAMTARTGDLQPDSFPLRGDCQTGARPLSPVDVARG
jgi:F-type H+-transporting ATPase subunit a